MRGVVVGKGAEMGALPSIETRRHTLNRTIDIIDAVSPADSADHLAIAAKRIIDTETDPGGIV